jgi:hypothetical protein
MKKKPKKPADKKKILQRFQEFRERWAGHETLVTEYGVILTGPAEGQEHLDEPPKDKDRQD